MVVAAGIAYEECRKKRLEENKRKMEQLKLHTLSQALKPPSTPSKSAPTAKRLRPKSDQLPLAPVRRSTRVADKPTPNYKEFGLEDLRIGRRVYNYKRRDLLNRVYANAEDRADACDRAEMLEATLQQPCCIKPMLQSHVTGGFWLSLPHTFCKDNLPDHDETVTLVDEDGDEWPTKYLHKKNGLSGGWRGFAIDHQLVDGDCLIFQLIKPNTLKVHIIRVNSSEEDEEEGQEDIQEAAEDAKVKGKQNGDTREAADEEVKGKKRGRKSKTRVNSSKEDEEEGQEDNRKAADDAKVKGKQIGDTQETAEEELKGKNRGRKRKTRLNSSEEDREDSQEDNQEAGEDAKVKGKLSGDIQEAAEEEIKGKKRGRGIRKSR